MERKFKEGDILVWDGAGTTGRHAAVKGATAVFKHYYNGWGDEEYVYVEWIRNGLDNEQMDGGYLEDNFEKLNK